MRKIRLNALLFTGLLLAGIYSCSKSSENFDPQGGLLPSHYIDIKDNSFSPSLLSVANGSSITFLNRSSISHTLVSDDSSTILSPTIVPNSFYFVQPDTMAGSQSVYIYYHCKEHPAVTGTIILTP